MAQQTLTIDQMYALARKAGFSVTGAIKAAMVGQAESSGRTWITSPNPDGGQNVGLMQLDTPGGLGAGYSVAQLQDPLTNMKVAFKTSKDGTDWHLWATWPDPAAKYSTQAADAAAKEQGQGQSWIDATLKALGNMASSGGKAGGDAAAASSGFGIGLPDQITGLFTALEKPVQALTWFLNPSNWARVLAGVVGFALLIAGLFTLGMAV